MKALATVLLLAGALLMTACAPSAAPAPVYTIAPSEPATAAAAASAAPQGTPQAHRVQPGDTLISIAMHYDLDYRELARWNNLRNPNLIQPGQQLLLVPPENDPVAAPVRRQNAPGLKPATSASESGATASAGVGTSAPVRRETTLIGGQQTAVSAAASPGNAPYKVLPQATQYAYSEKLLKKLREEWQARPQPVRTAPTAAAAAATAAPKAPAVPKPTAAPAKPAAPKPTAAASAAPGKTRQKYGVTWGLPTPGAVLKKFNAQSKGIAFDGARGAPVYAAADGEVIYVGTGVKSYGRLVILRHENDYLTAYAHNEEILVKEGQAVARGSPIAKMGDSGSERVMLHFEVRKGGKPLNPAQVLPQ